MAGSSQARIRGELRSHRAQLGPGTAPDAGAKAARGVVHAPWLGVCGGVWVGGGEGFTMAFQHQNMWIFMVKQHGEKHA